MKKRVLPPRLELSAYLSEAGYICIKQDNFGEQSLVALDPESVPTVIQWLQELLEERKNWIPENEEDEET